MELMTWGEGGAPSSSRQAFNSPFAFMTSDSGTACFWRSVALTM